MGQWVQDHLTSLLTPTVASDTELVVASTAVTAGRQYVGAIGLVSAGAGAGEGFVISGSYVDGANTHFTIGRLHDAKSPPDITQSREWEAGLNPSNSRVHLLLPGVVEAGAIPGGRVHARGVVQTVVATEDVNKFGWVQQSGVGLCAVTATPLTNGLYRLNYDDNGRFAGHASNGDVRRLVIPTASYTAATGAVLLAELQIENLAMSLIGAPPQRAIGTGPEAIR